MRYTAVDDVGRAVNPLILHGQTHGGIAQGVGQALWEQLQLRCRDRPAAVRLVHGLRDAARRRCCRFATEISEMPAPSNPLGVRAGGEGGTTPALGVVVNAVVDALAEFGVTHIEMPVTPEQVWQEIALKAASRAR